MTYKEGDILYKMKITPELMATWVARDFYGNLVTIEWGEPDEEGFYTPSFTQHLDDNIVVSELRKFKQALDLVKQPIVGMKGGVARRDIERMIDARIEGKPWHPAIQA